MKNNYIDNLKHVIYTFKHIICINKLAIKYKVWKIRYLFHDVDKLFMYVLLFWKSSKEIHKIHRLHSNHHIENIESKNIDWEMAILDWECARFTKPDKPLNARETLEKYYSEYKNNCLPILKKLGL